MKLSGSIIFGFIGGALVGFVWSQQTKASLSDHISSDFSNGKLVVTVDAARAAVAGFADIFKG